MSRLRKQRLFYFLLLAAFAGLLAGAVPAQAADAPVRITVDLTQAARRIFHAHLVIPASPGPLTLLYPKWIPGEHAPDNPIADLVGLKFHAAGKTLAWQRDDLDMFTFHLTVPAGATEVEADLDYVSPVEGGKFTSGSMSSTKVAVLEWNLVALYRAGPPTDDLTYEPSVKFPAGWKFGTALETASTSGNEVHFRPVSFTMLVDSPIIAGEYFRAIPLATEIQPRHTLDLAGETPESVDISANQIHRLSRLVEEAQALFGAHHYNHYDFLLAVSNHVQHFGLEHHQSSDNRTYGNVFHDPALWDLSASLLPHEFVHSWNAKYRRPAGLATPDFEKPMRDELLWVYEGLTQYLGNLLSARSGMRDDASYREDLAWVAAYLDHWPGREWRPLQDTATAAQILYGMGNSAWTSMRRSTDFYDESWLIWLEADTIIRRETHGQRSLDDFCRKFHGAPSTPPKVVPYTFDDVVKTMNEVAPYDWRTFFRMRLDRTGEHAPLDGIKNSGWRVVYNATPNQHIRENEAANHLVDLSFSLGIKVRDQIDDPDNGRLIDVIPGMPGAEAGLAPGMKLMAINGRAWSADGLHDALNTAKKSGQPIELLVENAEYFKSYRIEYRGGDRYPHLVREESQPDLLSRILHPLAGGAGKTN